MLSSTFRSITNYLHKIEALHELGSSEIYILIVFIIFLGNYVLLQ